MTALTPQIAAVRRTDGVSRPGAEELCVEWERATTQYAMLKEEMKEDGWLVRFRTLVNLMGPC
jgi:hypothetical protein